MQRLTGAQHQGCRLVNLGTGVTGSVLPRSSVKPCFRGASRFIVQAAQEAPAADSDDDRPSTVRRRRLFKGQSGAAGESSSTGDSSSAGSSNTAPVRQPRRTAEPPRDVLEDFAAAFESTLSRSPKTHPNSGSDDGGAFSYSSDPALRRDRDSDRRDRGSSDRRPYSSERSSDRRPYSGERGERSGRAPPDYSRGGRSSDRDDRRVPDMSPALRERLFGADRGGYRDSGWSGRGRKKKDDDTPLSLADFEGVDAEKLSPQKQELLEKLRAEADEAERRRLWRKECSETIRYTPRRSQDPILFQAMNRQWDEKVTKEELRGAKAAARKIAAVGLYDRNRSMKVIRRKALKKIKKKPEEELTEEEKLVAARAKEIRDAAAALSIQKTKQEVAEEAMGVPRSFARAKALPEGMWEELKAKYRTDVPQIKIGRRGCTESLITSIHNHWRSFECVKLRIHDDKSSRKMNLPRVNLLLRELEEGSGGVLLDAQGSSIWLYRGDFKPPPPPAPYRPPPAEELFQEQYTPQGSWHDIGGVVCYVVSSSNISSSSSSEEGAEGASEEAANSSSSSSSSEGSAEVKPAETDLMTVLMLPDHFPLVDSKLLLQVADKVAAKGALVVLADVLGAAPGHPLSNVEHKGEAPHTKSDATSYWPLHRWPLVKGRKLEYMAWFQTGPGSWPHLRPKMLQLLEAMQQQGLYDADATSPPAAAAADAAGAADADEASSSSSNEDQQEQQQQQPAVTGRPLGLIGVGWGNFILLQAAGDDAVVQAGAKALAAISPATYNKDYDMSLKLQLPVALLPAKYDTMDQMMLFINMFAKPWELRCIFKRFGKVRPGWSSWLPQWADRRSMRQATETLLTAVSWLKRELLGVNDGLIELPAPQLPAKTGKASEAAINAAATKAAKQAAADLAEAEAEAA